MTRVFVRCYAELNDFLPAERRQRTFEVEVEGTSTVGALLERLKIPARAVEVALVGGSSVGLEHVLAEGDRLACYPLFERYDIRPLLRIRGRPQRQPRFTVDPTLRGLALRLRALGFDAALGDEPPPPEDGPGGRIALVREPDAAPASTHRVTLSGTTSRAQVRELIRTLGLEQDLDRPPRCLRCNVAVHLDAPSASDDPVVRLARSEGRTGRCPRCDHRPPRALSARLRRTLGSSFEVAADSRPQTPRDAGPEPRPGG